MDLYEYQARDLFEAHGVPVLAGIVAQTPDEAKAAAEKIGGVTVVKAQVKVGGRGKAGGVKVAKTADEAYEHAKAILGMDIKGHTVHQVMIAQGADIAEEYYFSVLLDRANRTYLAMCSVEGGMEIEEVAATKPDRLAKVAVDAVKGVDLETARSSCRPRHEVYRDLRAGAESGWDFSSRWLDDAHRLATIRTTSILPVDLNALLYKLERQIAELSAVKNQDACAEAFARRAEARLAAIDQYLWNSRAGAYFDYDWQRGRQRDDDPLPHVQPAAAAQLRRRVQDA